jgi:hypothetical protein
MRSVTLVALTAIDIDGESSARRMSHNLFVLNDNNRKCWLDRRRAGEQELNLRRAPLLRKLTSGLGCMEQVPRYNFYHKNCARLGLLTHQCHLCRAHLTTAKWLHT